MSNAHGFKINFEIDKILSKCLVNQLNNLK